MTYADIQAMTQDERRVWIDANHEAWAALMWERHHIDIDNPRPKATEPIKGERLSLADRAREFDLKGFYTR